MNLLIKRTSAVFLVGCIALLSGCRESKNPTGAVVGYQKDEIAPTAEDTSDQTMYEPAAVDPNIDLLAQQYDELHPKRVAVLAPAPVAPPAPPAPPLAAKKILRAKTRVSELRGSFKTAKNGAITSITVESQDATLDDMKLFGVCSTLNRTRSLVRTSPTNSSLSSKIFKRLRR